MSMVILISRSLFFSLSFSPLLPLPRPLQYSHSHFAQSVFVVGCISDSRHQTYLSPASRSAARTAVFLDTHFCGRKGRSISSSKTTAGRREKERHEPSPSSQATLLPLQHSRYVLCHSDSGDRLPHATSTDPDVCSFTLSIATDLY